MSIARRIGWNIDGLWFCCLLLAPIQLKKKNQYKWDNARNVSVFSAAVGANCILKSTTNIDRVWARFTIWKCFFCGIRWIVWMLLAYKMNQTKLPNSREYNRSEWKNLRAFVNGSALPLSSLQLQSIQNKQTNNIDLLYINY